jgi:hypothetical protein
MDKMSNMIDSEKNSQYCFLKRNLNHSEDGLTNVIAIVLIISIIMTLIVGPYLTIVVPDQTKRNEAEHLDRVEESFLDLRAGINTQLAEEVQVQNTRIKLGTDDESVFVLGGSGALYFDSSEPLISISSYYDSQSIYARGSGNIHYTSKNLYLRDKTLTYESTGIISTQRRDSTISADPNFELVRRREIRPLKLETGFGTLGVGDKSLMDIYLGSTSTSTITFNEAKITWSGANASALTRLNIAGGTVEWSGNAASGVKITFDSNYNLDHGAVKLVLLFNYDIRGSAILIELFSTSGHTLTAAWPDVTSDTILNTYELTYPDYQTVDRIKFRNTGELPVTVQNIALSWVGNATFYKAEIPGHGDIVYEEPIPGRSSPVYFGLQNTSIFTPGQNGNLKLYFDGVIEDQKLNVKLFSENSTNTAAAQFPLDFNVTFINASFSIVTIISDTINIQGKSSKIIKTTLISSEDNRYIWETGENIVFNVTTAYPEAWIEYLNDTMAKYAGLVWDNDGIGAFYGDYYFTTIKKTETLTEVRLFLNSVYKMDCLIGIIKAELG